MINANIFIEETMALQFMVRNGHEYGTFTVNKETGSLAIDSSFGTYAYRWAAPGKCFWQFLYHLGFDYTMSKFCGGNYRVFDYEASVAGLVAFVEEQIPVEKRDQKIADIFEDLQDWRNTGQEFHDACRWNGFLDIFPDYFQDGAGIKEKDDPQCAGFWWKLWPVFKSEIVAPRIAGVLSKPELRFTKKIPTTEGNVDIVTGVSNVNYWPRFERDHLGQIWNVDGRDVVFMGHVLEKNVLEIKIGEPMGIKCRPWFFGK